MMEILAPAGSEEALIAAVQSGADAVYIGGNKFSARSSAKNFSVEDMKRLVEYCHVRGVAVHVAANILIKEKEADEFLDYIKQLNDINIDALIIQDIGMAVRIKEMFPDLPLHASTQMTAASLDTVKFLEKTGFSRVVLARELSYEEIKNICRNSNVEIEVFAHGALCMCYSGQCLMSSMIGGRSGNRGMCAQPCRLFYELENEKGTVKNGYLLSPKDLALIDEMKRLDEAGVASLKIEGRLKRPEYVSEVTNIYCKYKNFTGNVSEEDMQKLKNAFNRSGFTKAYFKGKNDADMMSIKTPGNVSENVFSKEAQKRCTLDANERKIGIDIYVNCSLGKPLEIVLTDDKFNSVEVSGNVIAQKAQNRPLTKERVSEQISKLGNTPFFAQSVNITLEDGINLPVSEINDIRRRAVLELMDNRCKRNIRRSFEKAQCDCEAIELYNKIFSAQVINAEQAKSVLKYDISVIYAPQECVEEIKKIAPDKKVITVLPPVWKDSKKAEYKIIDGVMVSNIGELERFKDYDCYGGARLNVYNNETLFFYKNLKSVNISYELNLNEIKDLKQFVPVEALVYGRIPLMVMENCPIKAYSKCKSKVCLKDRYKEQFPLVCAPGCFCELLNSKPLFMADKVEDLKKLPVSIYKFNFTVESAKECDEILSIYMQAFEEEKKTSLKENSFTRGHYYRGVE